MAARKTAPKPTAEAKQEAVIEETADICRACWPNGWPHLHHSAQCEHGTYNRDPETATPEQTPVTDPADTGDDAKQDPETPPTGDKTED